MIEPWRASLDDAKRRRLNHPSAIWAHWRRHMTMTTVSGRDHTTAPVKGYGKAIHWPQDYIRRAHTAMLRSKSSDLLTLARLALEAAVRNADDLDELFATKPTRPTPVEAPAFA